MVEPLRRLLQDFRAAARLKQLAHVERLGYQLIHADLVSEDVMVDGDNIGMLDFDDAGFSFRLLDLVTTPPKSVHEPSRISPFRAKMAMAVRSRNSHWKMCDILRRHWLALGAHHGILTTDGRDTERLIDETVDPVPQVISKVGRQPFAAVL